MAMTFWSFPEYKIKRRSLFKIPYTSYISYVSPWNFDKFEDLYEVV